MLSIVRDIWASTLIISSLPLVFNSSYSIKGFLLVFTLTIGYVFGFALNDYIDREEDRLDPNKRQKNFFVIYELPASLLIIVTLTLIIGFIYVFLLFNTEGIIVLAILMFGVYSYSMKPFQFKKRPGFDIAIHGIFVQFAPYIVVIYLMNLKFQNIDLLILSVLLLSSISGQIAGQLRDFEIDSKHYTTFAHLLGFKSTLRVYRMLQFTMIFISLYGFITKILPIIFLPIFLVGLVFIIQRPVDPSNINRYSKKINTILGVLAIMSLLVTVLSINLLNKY